MIRILKRNHIRTLSQLLIKNIHNTTKHIFPIQNLYIKYNNSSNKFFLLDDYFREGSGGGNVFRVTNYGVVGVPVIFCIPSHSDSVLF